MIHYFKMSKYFFPDLTQLKITTRLVARESINYILPLLIERFKNRQEFPSSLSKSSSENPEIVFSFLHKEDVIKYGSLYVRLENRN